MPILDKYRREDMLGDLDEVTKQFEWRAPVETWVCDCGCDNASWCQRTSGGLAYYMQAWPQGMAPKVMIFETREDVERFLVGMASTPLATSPLRLESFCTWIRACWNTVAEA